MTNLTYIYNICNERGHITTEKLERVEKDLRHYYNTAALVKHAEQNLEGQMKYQNAV